MFRYFLVLALFFSACQPRLSNEDALKELVAGKVNFKLCFYPSTLRMINLTNNSDYNELVGDVKKVLFYSLDQPDDLNDIIDNAKAEFELRGFETFAEVYGGKNTMVILGDDSRSSNQFIVLADTKEQGALALYVNGNIGFEKIPKLINSFQDEEMLNIFQLGDITNNNRRERNR